MLAKHLINDSIIPLRTSDTAVTALSWMEDLRVSHLPIVNNKNFLGLISDMDIYDQNKPEEPLGNHNLSLIRPYLLYDQHFYDAIKLVSEQKLTLVPVLDNDNNYLGCITLFGLAERLTNITSINEPGGIIVLEANSIDYSLSEIARIVESNDAKILSSYITSFSDNTKFEVTIKVNKIDVTSIIQTFNRFDYIITASFSEESNFDDLIKDRYKSLMSYLNI